MAQELVDHYVATRYPKVSYRFPHKCVEGKTIQSL